tara:strand:- start:1361 stop:2086 length:726 start_codon:yes stop_codon:yes gene_type:complete
MGNEPMAISWEQYKKDSELNINIEGILESQFSEYGATIEKFQEEGITNCGYINKTKYHVKNRQGKLVAEVEYDDNFNVEVTAYSQQLRWEDHQVKERARNVNQQLENVVQEWGSTSTLRIYHKKKNTQPIVPLPIVMDDPSGSKEMDYEGRKIIVHGPEDLIEKAEIVDGVVTLDLPSTRYDYEVVPSESAVEIKIVSGPEKGFYNPVIRPVRVNLDEVEGWTLYKEPTEDYRDIKPLLVA